MAQPPAKSSPPAAVLLDWYDQHRRHLPWRAAPGALMDPYRVWLSEIMLQQTTVAAVLPYYDDFLKAYPTIFDLARAPLEDVLQRWAGLGYYARARNLHRCARVLADEAGGVFPSQESALKKLPGIGTYTAAAIASMAFGARAVVVDGNVERIIARLYALETPLPQAKPHIYALADDLTPPARAGDFAQAMMDLGSRVCTPRAPRCGVCPWEALCCAAAGGAAHSYPRKAPKSVRPTRQGIAFWLEAQGRVWLRRRPDRGLLGGLLELPSIGWSAPEEGADPRVLFPDLAWQAVPGHVVHVLTHFRLELSVMRAAVAHPPVVPEGIWVPIDGLATVGLPTAMRKAAQHAQRTK